MKEQAINVVTGAPEMVHYYPFCIDARKDESTLTILADEKKIVKSNPNCGPDAVWFQKKEIKSVEISKASSKVNLKDVTADDL